MRKMPVLFFLCFFLSLECPVNPVDSAPLKGMTVVVDPGHGGYDPGAVCGGVSEKDINLAIAVKLKKMLEKSGARVIMTRAGDYDLAGAGTYKRERYELSKRLAVAREHRADILLSIHSNSFGDPVLGGPEVIYNPDSQGGKVLAQCIQQELLSLPGIIKRAVKPDRCLVLSDNEIPSVLVEVGFISNPGERKKLIDSRYQTALSEKITRGVEVFCRRGQ